MEQALDVEVKRLLEARRGDWQAVANDKAAGVSYSWLSKFANGHIENPGYATLKRLHAYLTGEPPPSTEPGALDEAETA